MKRALLPLLLAFTAPAVARGFVINPTLEAKPSPCAWDIDASFMKDATRGWKTAKATIEQTFNCDGAVPLSVSVQHQGEQKWFEFTIGLKSGHDRDGLMQFSLVDADGKTVAFGEARDNLDEGKESVLEGPLMIKNEVLLGLIAHGKLTLHLQLTATRD